MSTVLILSITLLAQLPTGHDHAALRLTVRPQPVEGRTVRSGQAMKARGDDVMGFAHDKTTHHFRLAPDGGEIEVGANDPNDTASAQQIRAHLRHIAQKFAAGDFNAPFLIHAQVVPGTEAMTRLRKEISYSFESHAAGGRVRISTRNPEALKAIHEFLRFQIAEHRTADPPK